ncbi:hypothetical protein [Sphingomonas sp.]|jgi:hypothetical protein|uniref:hypothetical protein n=1 Tax=Sphingomonas sp. TaxID=28214 RepID=UPI002E330FD0|nr:hypothetical protein [Sphingomonas sp.]HEX4695075.1 hypothetical protein [Sphingomonas sp.]
MILDAHVTELDKGLALMREHLAELGCPPRTLVQFDDCEDRGDGERWLVAEPRSIDEEQL